MATQARNLAETVRLEPLHTYWAPATRLAFRFCFVYFGLYCLTNQILLGLLPISGIDLPDLGRLPPVRPMVFWTAAHIFRSSTPLVYQGSGSGDKTFDWVLLFCLLSIALAATVLWSMLDRRRPGYTALHKWLHVFLRFAVGSEMVAYGIVKIIPLQMPFPSLTRLVEPYGNFSPMGVLWYSVGASPGYERFVGSAEMLGGILLFVPRTATLGALVCLADLTEIFLLNMTYDVPVKQFSFHLIVITLILLTPELQRIACFFLSNREIGPSTRPVLFVSPRANRIAVAVQILFGLLLIGSNALDARRAWYTRGGGAPKSPLYGIWNVEQLSTDGTIRPPLLTDNDRWRRVIFDRPNGVAFQRMDDTFVNYGATVNTKDGAITLTKPNDQNSKSNLQFQRRDQDRLTLDGEVDGHRLHMDLRLLDRSKLLLVSRGFHWIQEYPFNR
ncbi:MAG: DoxX family protein [Acidobacteriia bacterium]|nr:DoxX family protein [Terriglobia bacterium]